ncbi:MAG TPA: BamA/TamA family outer membrane protein [bacterium]
MIRTRFVVFIVAGLFSALSLLAQEKKDDVPQEQTPVEERDTGDSFIENVGELPGKLITLPLRILFKGVSKMSSVVDYQAVVLRVTDVLTNEDGTRKVRPIFTPLSGGGLIFVQRNFLKPGMSFRTSASAGIRTRANFFGSLRDPQLFSSRFGVQIEGLYQRLPDEDFFGIGNDSRRATETNYLQEETYFMTELLAKPVRQVTFTAGVSYSDVNIKDGRDPNKPSLQDSSAVFFANAIPGLFGARMATFLFRIYRDTRDVTGNPNRGSETYFTYEYGRELGGSEFGYSKFTLDWRGYLDLFYRRVIALRLHGEITDNIGEREIPFYRLGGLGGTDVFRGYRPTRFRDKDLLVAGAEYRYPIHGVADMIFFFEQGRVFGDIFDQFTFNGFKRAFGGGLRLRGFDGNLVAVFEIAKSDEQLRLNFSLNKGLRRF